MGSGAKCTPHTSRACRADLGPRVSHGLVAPATTTYLLGLGHEGISPIVIVLNMTSLNTCIEHVAIRPAARCSYPRGGRVQRETQQAKQIYLVCATNVSVVKQCMANAQATNSVPCSSPAGCRVAKVPACDTESTKHVVNQL